VAVDARRFKEIMAQLATAVTVVTVMDRQGRPMGMTASAVCSLSLEPPMLLVCVDRAAGIHDALVRSPFFAVNVLAREQEQLAVRFARRDLDHFDGIDWDVGPAGLAVLRGSLAQLECRRAEVFPAGDHAIVTGVVEWAQTRDRAPLCYFRARYTGLGA
jgi:flavin reductase (DIM6/NTAB) family NADH-FMN oxidoreductase RutF